MAQKMKSRAKAESEATGEDAETYIGLYRKIVLIRRFEEAVHSLFLRGEVYGSTHLCNGQEAVDVGVVSALKAGDKVAATYRGHGNVLALGVPPQSFMDELLGRESGMCGGRAGSMNVIDGERGLIGCFGIIGGALATATGAALALRGSGSIAVGYLGDGAVNQGYFYECLNFAKVMGLPVLYVCENNLYGEYTPMEKVTPGGIGARVDAMEISNRQVDGQDLWAVREAASEAAEEIRSGGGPCFIEALTYRYADHGRGDPVKYRPDEEVAAWKKRDPIDLTRARLIADFGVSEERLAEVDAGVEAEMAEVRSAALEAPWPSPEAPVSEFAPAGWVR